MLKTEKREIRAGAEISYESKKVESPVPYHLTLRNRLESAFTLGGICGIGSSVASGLIDTHIMVPVGVAVGSYVSAKVLYEEIKYAQSVKNGEFRL